MTSNILPFTYQDIEMNQSRKKWSRKWSTIACWSIILICISAIGLHQGGILDWTESDDEWDTESSDGGTGTTLSNTTCTTTACKNDADALISAMNSSVDPCQDFYQYACGGWIKHNPLPAGQSSLTPLKILDRKVSSNILNILKSKKDQNDSLPLNQAKDFFTSCMDTDLRETVGLQPLLNLLDSFGGWPMTLKTWDQKTFSWQKTTSAITRLYQTGVLLAVRNGPDWRSTSKNIIYIEQASFFSEYHGPSYTRYITGSARAIRDAMRSTASNSQIDIDVADMMKFEYSLARIQKYNADNKYYHMSLQDLQVWTDSVTTTTAQTKVNWFEYLNDVYHVGAGINILNDEHIVVKGKQYLKSLVSLLSETPLRTVSNYVQWNLVHQLGKATTKQMRDLNSRFTGTSDLSTTCAGEINNYFGFAISYKYAASYVNEKNEALAMVANFKTAFKSLVNKADWMNRATKRKVKGKLDNMTTHIGYPDWVLVKDLVEKYYSSISTSRGKYLENFQNASAFLNTQAFKGLRRPTDREYWDCFPSSASMFYDRFLDTITISAGVLQTPFFKRDRFAALNYGALGSVIGHEITHGFDFTSGIVDYRERAKCFVEQYGKYTSPRGTPLNGQQTLDENIADNGALRQAFRAYKIHVSANGVEPKLPGLENFTSEQLFFLGFAHHKCETKTPESLQKQIQSDSHSPYNFRVIGALSNSEDFVTHFNCPAGSPMNRLKKCTLW